MAPRLLRRVCFHALRLMNYVAPLYKDRARFPDDVVLVVGSARSGTTWVADVIARATNARVIFEPFLVSRNRNFVLTQRILSRERVARNYPLYIPTGGMFHGKYHEVIEQILRGRIRSFWSEMEARPGVFRHRVIKDIRANLFLGFIAENWPGVKIIFVVRNPYSTVSSQLGKVAHGWDFSWDKADVLSQEQLMRDWLVPFAATLERAQTLVERLTNRWCIETYLGFHQLRSHPRSLVVSYEKLSDHPSNWHELAQFLSACCWDEQAFRTAWSRASFTALRNARQIREREDNCDMLDKEAKALIAQVVDEYGLGEVAQQRSAGPLEQKCRP